jgi:hypothetical protein
MLDFNYTLPVKASGPANCIAPDGLYYGTINWTWNFAIHGPVMTIEYAENNTGETLAEATAGSLVKAEAELLKIARLTKDYVMNRIASKDTKEKFEYRLAHDTDLINDWLIFQLNVLQTWGGYDSMFRVTDSGNQQSIGKAAEDYVKGLNIWSGKIKWEIPDGGYRSGY